MVTVPVSVPPETLQVEDDMRPGGPDVNVHDVSEPANPVPLTLIDCPGLPNAGFRVRVGGDPTLKRADAESPGVGPYAVTVYPPGVAVGATVNWPETDPDADIVHETPAKRTGATGTWLSRHAPASAGSNPTPEKVTKVPMLPELGFRVILATITRGVGIP